MTDLLVAVAAAVGLVAAAPSPEAVRQRYSWIEGVVSKGGATEVRLYPQGPDARTWTIVAPTPRSRRTFDESEYRARAFVIESALAKVVFETRSPSGDWTLKESYYFYPRCGTAFYLAELVTFAGYDVEHQKELPPGPYVVERRRYFDEKGTEVRTLQKVFVQSTGAPLSERSVKIGIPDDAYRSCAALPFGKMLP